MRIETREGIAWEFQKDMEQPMVEGGPGVKVCIARWGSSDLRMVLTQAEAATIAKALEMESR